MKPDARLLDKLAAARYRLNRARPSVGVGDRRSTAKGAGMEFAAHRPYREGDDVRHLDLRLLARLGENYIREYFVDRQVPVYVILDASRSMCSGRPEKYPFAAKLAQLFGFLALTSGDRVQMGVYADGRLNWSPRLQGANRAEILFGWVVELKPGGAAPFSAALRQANHDMVPSALVVLVSDFLDENLAKPLAALSEAGHDMIAVHVASPEEMDPAVLGNGPVRLHDAETGEDIEITLTRDMADGYRAAFAAFQDKLREAVRRGQGRYFCLKSDADVERFILRDLKSAGLII